jgi:hypothetical protein
VKKLTHPARGSQGEGLLVLCSRKTGNRRFHQTACCLVFNGLAEGLRTWFLYIPITAADEKIPLPVVDVNKKPQYLVFQ